MSDKDNGGQAFPCMYPNADNMGMSLRDYMAAKAMQAMAAAPLDDRPNYRDTAKFAYEYADAMLAARAKPQRKDGDE